MSGVLLYGCRKVREIREKLTGQRKVRENAGKLKRPGNTGTLRRKLKLKKIYLYKEVG